MTKARTCTRYLSQQNGFVEFLQTNAENQFRTGRASPSSVSCPMVLTTGPITSAPFSFSTPWFLGNSRFARATYSSFASLAGSSSKFFHAALHQIVIAQFRHGSKSYISAASGIYWEDSKWGKDIEAMSSPLGNMNAVARTVNSLELLGVVA